MNHQQGCTDAALREGLESAAWDMLHAVEIADAAGELAENIGGELIDALRASLSASSAAPSEGVRDVVAERQRQIYGEGFDEAHDEQWAHDELVEAAVCYCEAPTLLALGLPPAQGPGAWPWDLKWWKPKDRRRDLVRAAALIIAEIDRLDRVTVQSPAGAAMQKEMP